MESKRLQAKLWKTPYKEGGEGGTEIALPAGKEEP
jgi:hypothetical protein